MIRTSSRMSICVTNCHAFVAEMMNLINIKAIQARNEAKHGVGETVIRKRLVPLSAIALKGETDNHCRINSDFPCRLSTCWIRLASCTSLPFSARILAVDGSDRQRRAGLGWPARSAHLRLLINFLRIIRSRWR